MTQETRIPPLRRILPLAQLVLCALILWPMRPMLVDEVRDSLQEYGILHDMFARNPAPLTFTPFDLDDPEVQRRIRVSETREWAVAAMNLPGGLPDMTFAILSPAHSEWIPKGMLMWTWRDLSWPIVGMFFWWLAGRSIEALLASRQKILVPEIRWWEIMFSLPAAAFGAVCVIGLGLDPGSRREFPILWMFLGTFGGMWLTLGASTSVAYFVQRRLRRRLASTALEQGRMLISTS